VILFALANGTLSAFAGGGDRDRQEQTTRQADDHGTVKGIDDLRHARPVIGRGLGALEYLGEGLSPLRPTQPFTESGGDDILAEIQLQAISSVGHPRHDGAFNNLVGFSKGFAEIETLGGQALWPRKPYSEYCGPASECCISSSTVYDEL
jgi:hypothetical protein